MVKIRRLIDFIVKWLLGAFFSQRTILLMRFDTIRFIARAKNYFRKDLLPPKNKLHFGCAWRRVPGWLNVDVRHSEFDVDLADGRLPWKNNVFETTVSQHVIEHLELETELLPLLRELHRVMKPGGEIWLSCPDIESICNSYLIHAMEDLLLDRLTRFPNYSIGELPTNHFINALFHQQGEHKNLYDFVLLKWILQRSGFTGIERVVEADLLHQFPEFPQRNDDLQSIYVRAVNS